ncbi:sulfur oxidation c-type cytochrome SoxA [Defluviimonas sp. WL0024]|uniref:SoxAX cytochrome complex subunit A n=2 Tax=Albidovulum TaxID=205889 RepID=A0ABT3J3R6_9RHOB|nr:MULTISPECIES: sulfur oxidation c-type cytochrome SoxA [Defluviimonas]MCU9847944.1 sulfur oxidation c-type cytochrome SoxA [Defluviimonas sp. WL0024]MCW3782342.1 sulfur oxidation c-type cytochrome SoxA [Defluviimonas salinarum]
MRILAGTCALAAFALSGLSAVADPADDTLVVNGEIQMITHTDKAPDYIDGLSEQYSGWHFREADTRVMQADDFDNPGMLGVEAATEVWNAVDGSEGKACASCHEAPESMAGVRTQMPSFNEAKGEMYTMEMYINECRAERMGAEAWDWDSSDMVNMTALISSVSRGMPMNVAVDGPAQSYWEKGKEMYYTRYGQLELACSNCHEDNYGNFIRADHLSQGQINGFPVYRLKDAKLSSIHNRFKGCIRDTRGETFKPGSPELIALELYVASRGNGLSVEGPSVRN